MVRCRRHPRLSCTPPRRRAWSWRTRATSRSSPSQLSWSRRTRRGSIPATPAASDQRRALGPQVGQHHVLEVAGHPGERRQPLSRVMALAQQVVELGDERDAAAQPVVEVAEVVGRDHQRGVGAPCPRRARMAREVRVERGSRC